MAQRDLLHKSKLDDFRSWLFDKGWSIEDTKGDYEVLRAVKDKRTLILYRRAEVKEHYSVQDKDVAIVREYIKDRKSRPSAYWKPDVKNEQAEYVAAICSNCNMTSVMDEKVPLTVCPYCHAEMRI